MVEECYQASKRADGVREARSLFQERGSGAIPTSALQLNLEVVDFEDAKKLNRLWHSRLPRIGDPNSVMRAGVCYGAVFDGRYYASAIWSHPAARLLPQDSWLELRRLAVAPDAPRNTASRMLGVMTRLIRKCRPKTVRLISYQDTEVHTGGIYKAAGWVAVSTTGFQRKWGCPSRPRPPSQSEAVKRCWDRCLVCSMGPDRNQMCEVCRERIPDREADADPTDPAGA